MKTVSIMWAVVLLGAASVPVAQAARDSVDSADRVLSSSTRLRASRRAAAAPVLAKKAPSDYDACSASSKPGDLCSIAVADVRTTQALVGLEEVACKQARFESMKASDVEDYLVAHVFPGYVGPPSGSIYITDHHHTGRALLDADIDDDLKVVVVEIQENWADLAGDGVRATSAADMAQFWSAMAAANQLWLYDDKGQQPLNPNLLPTSLDRMVNWPYRSLAWAVRNNGGYAALDLSFQDFLWALFFQAHNLLPPANNGTGVASLGGARNGTAGHPALHESALAREATRNTSAAARVQAVAAARAKDAEGAASDGAAAPPVTSWTFCEAAPFDSSECYPDESERVMEALGAALALAFSPAASSLPGYLQGTVDYPNCGNSTSKHT